MGRATRHLSPLRDELGCPLWLHLKPTPSVAGWYEVRSGHWELLLWVIGDNHSRLSRVHRYLIYWESLEGLESAVPITDGLPIRFRLPTVWEHLNALNGGV